MQRAEPWTDQTDAMTVRLSIGDFSRMTYLSVKSLRRYHDMGLLAPADVDRESGYRYYEADQVPIGQVIRRFRDLGMPLDQVKEVLQAPDAASRNELIVVHLQRMESELEQTKQTVSSLRALLESPLAPISVEYRSVGATPAVAISEPVAMGDIETWWMKKMSTATQAIARRTAPATDACGTNAGAASTRSWIVRRTSKQYMKVATNVPSTTWLPLSRMNVRRRRGPNCADAWVRAAMVIEKTTPATVMTDPATVDSSCTNGK